jgi:hypothetical protein
MELLMEVLSKWSCTADARKILPPYWSLACVSARTAHPLLKSSYESRVILPEPDPGVAVSAGWVEVAEGKAVFVAVGRAVFVEVGGS